MTELNLATAGPLQSFIVQLIAFALLIFVLVKFVVPILSRTLAQRTQGIQDTFQKIEREITETARALADLKEKLAQVDRERERRFKAALDDATRSRDQLLSEAQAQAEAARERARREIQIERDKAILELRQQAIALTLSAADHLIQKTMNDSIQERLVETYLNQLESVKKP